MDGIPNAILEAMTIGTPVVACNTGGISEVVKNMETGILSEAPYPHELSKALIYAIKHPLHMKDMAKNARKIIEKEFSLQHNTELLESHFYRIIKQNEHK
jgi:glycosyltransferase involved in cell wall biosynthesis